jgi:rubrerythrin
MAQRKSAIKDTLLTTTLNDLLQLDVDAISAYALVIRQLESKVRKEAVRRYQSDHRRHVRELKRVIKAYGGASIAVSHMPTGPFKVAMQAIGSAGGDRAVLLAFKTNERQGRDKYRRAATTRGFPRDVARVLKRASRDEERHYRWAEKQLEQLHAGRRTTIGKVAGIVEVANARTVDAIEEVEKPIMTVVEVARRGVRAAAKHPVRTAAIAAAITSAAGAAVALRGGRRR